MKKLMVMTLCLAFTIAFAGASYSTVIGGPEAPVYCIGTESGGGGGPLASTYCYEVYVVTGTTMTAFEVGWHGGTCPNIYAVDGSGLPLADWGGTPNSPGSQQDYFEKTPHGQISAGPSGTCPAITLWQGPELGAGTYYFGHFDPSPSHDVGWEITSVGSTAVEEWYLTVGDGFGPVHAPIIPEPGSIALIGIGLLAMMKRK